MKVISYLSGVPANNKNSEKTEVLNRFIDGVIRVGDQGIAHNGAWQESDLGVIQGYVHTSSPGSPHLKLRRSVIENQARIGKHSLIIDSNLFLYADTTNSKHYLRYSLDGVFPTTGNYFTDNVDPSRWLQISNDLGIKLENWNTNGKHILVCLQRNGGWSMGGLDVMDWLRKIIKEIKQYSDRPIVVRAHPGDKKARQYLKLNEPNVKISSSKSIVEDFQKAHACVTYNSSPGVAAAIQGVQVFITDPQPQTSQAFGVAHTDLSKLEEPIIDFDRQTWVEKLCMSHWNFDELSSGKAWKVIREYL
jgi:hypothetical protein